MPDWTFGERLYLIMVCVVYLAFMVVLLWASTPILQEFTSRLTNLLNKLLVQGLTRLMTWMVVSINDDGVVGKSYGPIAVLLLIVVGVFLVLHWVADKSVLTLLLIEFVMVLLTFILCSYESAINAFEGKWSGDLVGNPVTVWFTTRRTKHEEKPIGEIRFQFIEVTHSLCMAYIEHPERSFASLLLLAAFVDVTGAGIVAHIGFVHSDNPIAEIALDSIIVTIPLVILGELIGTVVGRRMPKKVLIVGAIGIWLVYFPASLAVGWIAKLIPPEKD